MKDQVKDLRCRYRMGNNHENYQLWQHEFTGRYDFAQIQPCNETVDKLIRFNDIGKCPIPEEYGVHFYIDDYRFRAVWSDPDKYIPALRKFKLVIEPEFSFYDDFPLALKIHALYRRRWLAAYWQKHGINVVANARWGTPDTYDWIFDGVPKHSTVAVSSLGLHKDPDYNGERNNYFERGYEEMLKRCEPSCVLYYGRFIVPPNPSVPVIRIPSMFEALRGNNTYGWKQEKKKGRL